MKSQYKGITGIRSENGSMVWNGAMALAWQQIKNKLNTKIQLDTLYAEANQTVEDLNQCSFKPTDISEDDAIFGILDDDGVTKTLIQAKREVEKKLKQKGKDAYEKKFPLECSVGRMAVDRIESKFITYGYLCKKIEFVRPFTVKTDFEFNERPIYNGFSLKDQGEGREKQVLIWQKIDQENFVVQLPTKDGKDQIFLIKSKEGFKELSGAAEKINEIQARIEKPQEIKPKQGFQMPQLCIRIKNSNDHLKDTPLKGEIDEEQYYLSQVIQHVDICLNQVGFNVNELPNPRVVNSSAIGSEILKLNKKFWLVMKQKNKTHPYLIACIKAPREINTHL